MYREDLKEPQSAGNAKQLVQWKSLIRVAVKMRWQNGVEIRCCLSRKDNRLKKDDVCVSTNGRDTRRVPQRAIKVFPQQK